MPAGDAGLEEALREAGLRIWDERGQLRTEIGHLQAQLAAQQAVVDAARAFDAVLSSYCDGPERDRLRAALDNVQAAQPEGEMKAGK